MKYLRKHYEEMTTEQLVEKHAEIEERINQNDGRLTTDSSADLDYNLDKRDIIDEIILERMVL